MDGSEETFNFENLIETNTKIRNYLNQTATRLQGAGCKLHGGRTALSDYLIYL